MSNCHARTHGRTHACTYLKSATILFDCIIDDDVCYIFKFYPFSKSLPTSLRHFRFEPLTSTGKKISLNLFFFSSLISVFLSFDIKYLLELLESFSRRSFSSSPFFSKRKKKPPSSLPRNLRKILIIKFIF